MSSEANSSGTRGEQGPFAAAVFLAAVAVFAHAGVSLWSARGDQALRQQEAQAQRILQAIDVADPQRAAANLRLLADAGLIENLAGPVEAFQRARADLPAMDDYDLNGNGRIDQGREAEVFLLHANAPEIRLFDEDMDGELDLPEMTRHFDYMNDLMGGSGAAPRNEPVTPPVSGAMNGAAIDGDPIGVGG